MADIFISYSKADHALALKLSAFLEAEGWTVWWDKSLAAADLYRDEIMKQLATARAVITIWSPNSVRSDWVRAEAGTAKNEGKLIPVKTPDVAYGDIPLPFGEMHTENLEASQLIRAAVVAQLAKPAVEPSAVALLTKGFKYELLTWWGIIGGAITLFVAISTTLKLADWARALVQHWKEWTHAFWTWAFGWLGIHLPPEWTPVLSFLLFGSLLTIGQALQFSRVSRSQSSIDKYREHSFKLISRHSAFCLLSIGAILVIGVLASAFASAPILGAVIILIGPQIVIILFAKSKLQVTFSVLLLFIFSSIIAYGPLINIDAGPAAGYTWILMGSFLPLILLSIAPAKAISRRLIFLALGLLLLIALNELSKLVHYWGVQL